MTPISTFCGIRRQLWTPLIWLTLFFISTVHFTTGRFTYAVEVRTIALSGDVAPGSSFTFDFFAAPTLNNNGHVAVIV